ncbi:MAG: DUF1592 domain-containing protein [Verrucomicrobiales bacterium]
MSAGLQELPYDPRGALQGQQLPDGNFRFHVRVNGFMLAALKTPTPIIWRMLSSCLFGALAFAPGRLPAQEAPLAGDAIYAKLCVECHGKHGEGVAEKCDEPLHGERLLEALAKYIDREMPENAPEKCVGEDAKRVAAYIFEAFYSPAARARNNPPKLDAARLTNGQFRESIADLVGSFGKSMPPGPGVGLDAQYFGSRGMNKKARKVVEREDRVLDFDFGEGPPAEGISPEQFSIAWQGSLLATATGWYEFRIRTPNGARLYLNGELREGDGNFRDDSDAKRYPATIDAWVSSGEKVREEMARVFLLGGRSYPLRLDYFKFKEKRGSIRLEWKPPHGVWEVLAAPYLSPARAGHVAVVSTAFPADDASVGYERGTAVSKDWHEATSKAAVEVATEVIARIERVSGVADDAADRVPRLKEFVATFAERAFRRPLSDALRQLYVERAFADGLAPELAVKRAVMLIVKSPRFLYPEIGSERDDFTVAARLALGFWDSLPDAPLLEAAKAGQLRTPEQINAHAGRLLQDPRSKAKVGEFFEHWLAMDEADDVSKDPKAYPGFDAALLADLRRSLELFVEHVVWNEKSDYRELLEADYIFLNQRLARFYDMAVAQDGDFHPVKFDANQRAGILTHPFLLTTLSYHKSTSPIHRGVFLTRNVLGRFLKPPPMAIEFMDDRFDPSLTMREKVTELTSKTTCMGCHVTINPLGFSLESFDAVGRFRTTDNNKPVNSESEYTTSDGEVIRLRGPRDVASHAAGTESARRGFVRQLFHSLIKQPPAAYGPATLDELDAAFAASGHHMRNLIIAINARAAQHAINSNKQASR